MKKSLAAAILGLGITTLFAMTSIYEIPINDIDGKKTSLKAYQGKVILLVNVASKCGYTPQYKGLEAIHRKFKDQGLVVLGVPSNDFGSQEPGSAEEIKTFCSTTYDVTFPLTEKIHVKGSEQHPLYAALTGKDSSFPGDVKWNFSKFLIGRDGKVIKRYDSKVAPESEELTGDIEKALAAK
ncbi:MAG: glutathione peroxidase [Verrucomicrobiota bacterium]|nr:glutathione peroxidase [Verrucomicrobiota bacterium]